jgi:hypothetical protein
VDGTVRVVVSAFTGNVRILISKTGFWTKLEQVVTILLSH